MATGNAAGTFDALGHAFVSAVCERGPPTEGGSVASSGFSRPWAVPLVVEFGGLSAGLLVYRFAPKPRGTGRNI